MSKNILITSISKKVPLISSFRKAIHRIGFKSEIYGGDYDYNVIAKYFVDQFWEMPSIDKLIVDDVINYCKEKNINGIIPTRDGELLFWAKNKNRLAEENIHVMISDYNVIKTCNDKLLFFEECNKIIKKYNPEAILTYNGAGSPSDPINGADILSIEGHAPEFERQSFIGRWGKLNKKPLEILTPGALSTWNGWDQKPVEILKLDTFTD